MKTILFLILNLFSINAIAQAYDVAKTWEGAVVYVPGRFFTRSISTVDVPKPMPTVILMHGCAGISPEEHNWARFLKGLGFIVIMPDSFASPGRLKNCDSGSHQRNLGLVPVIAIRQWEVEYAAHFARQQSWIDKKNLFLMGHSEGGMGVSMARGRFTGVIVSGYICTFGVFAAPQVPVLAISWEKDPWFSETHHCKDKWGERYNSTQVILPGSGHGTFLSSKARNEVEYFLKSKLRY
jgi:dienelactone hydrolase